ncbi:hypothetical protein ACI6Q5_06345 [Xanthomonas codiaei]|uniref:Lipoprotein n=1 Tax=Xanthomonas codiaei TaxID=56463 RepID=A0A2S7CLX4_9XANT|nr:hypothetical protein [Xanthomonas codiaei]PPU62499.1 hypothetical protein XcodCFBP4690_14050 [Xanthomonas codiaei]
MSRPSNDRLTPLPGAILPALLFAAMACSAGEPNAQAAARGLPAAPAPVTAVGQQLAAVIQASGVTCTTPLSGTGCTAGNVDAGDFYDVELLPECGDKGFFAGVARTSGADILDAVPATGSTATATAHLAQGQLICIQGIARAGQHPRYYYVVAIPASSVAACKNAALCQTYGDRPIKRLQPTTGAACRPAAQGRDTGDCAQGWVDAAALDVFSNGI